MNQQSSAVVADLCHIFNRSPVSFFIIILHTDPEIMLKLQFIHCHLYTRVIQSYSPKKLSWESICMCVAEEKDQMALQIKNSNPEMMTTTDEVKNNNAELSANNILVQQTCVPWECTSACYHTPRKRLIQQRTTSQLLVFIFPTTTSTQKMFPDTTLTGRKCTCVFLGCVFLWSSQIVSGSIFLGDSTTCGGGIPPCTTKQQKWNGCGQLFAIVRAYHHHIQFDNGPRQGPWQQWCRTGKRQWVVVITMWKLATVDGLLNVPTTADSKSANQIANLIGNDTQRPK